jgi:hypothetical protein
MIASQECLFFTVFSEDGGDNALGMWRFDQPPSERVLVPVRWPVRVEFDPSGRRAFIPHSATVVDFATKTTAAGGWPEDEWAHADYDPHRGLLLSNHASKPSTEPWEKKWNPDIVRFELTSGQSERITTGSEAVWGPGEWVYFSVGSTQLWRCRTDGSKREPVFMKTREPQYAHSTVPVVSADGTRVAYQYALPGMIERSAIVLIDFAAQEYRVLDIPCELSFAWVVPMCGYAGEE